MLVGLKMQKALNGQQGTLIQFDEQHNRWEVAMDNGSKPMIKAENLQACMEGGQDMGLTQVNMGLTQVDMGLSQVIKPGDRIRLVGLKAQADMNGQEGNVVTFDGTLNRWKVEMDNGAKT